jgi:hypothetical protein
MAIYTDNFNRANESPIASPWTGTDRPQLLTNQVAGLTASTDQIAYYNNTFANNQYSQASMAVLGNNALADGCGVAVRVQSATKSAYTAELYTNGTVLSIFKYSSGTGVKQGADISVSFAAGDILKLTATGGATTTLEVFKNGVSQGTRTDSTSAFTSGFAGVYCYSTGVARLDDWEGGDINQGIAIPWIKM